MRRVLFGFALVACAKPQANGPDASSAPADNCTPAALGLASAKAATPWTVPSGCRATGPAALVRNADQLRSALGCDAPVDFAKASLLVGARTMSPASLGTDVYDDGKTLTLVNRFRSPCPGDPMPMPMQFTLAVTVPAGDRTIHEVSCDVATKCK